MSEPQASQYGIDQLYKYPRYTRATYFAQFNADAPPYQPAQLIKRWQISAADMAGHAPTDQFTYRYVDAGDGQYKTNSISYSVAAQLNLPGATTYPKYVIQPTQATAAFAPGVYGPINPDYLANKSDADQMASELNAGQPFEPAMPFGPILYPAGETRRAWSITLSGGVQANAGVMLKEKYKYGVGAPGHWSSLTNPQWVADVQTTVDANVLPEVPIPSRELFPDEVIARVFMGGWVVQKTQLATKLNDEEMMPDRIREIWQAVVAPNPIFIKT